MNEATKQWAGPVAALNATELADHYAVGQLPKIYALGMDMRDYALVRSAFAGDATGEGKDGMEPIEQYLEFVYGVAKSFPVTQHLIANQHITVSGDEAVVWSYGIAHHKMAPGTTGNELIAGVQYRDRCRRYPQGWLITERRMALQWMDRGPAPVGG